MATLAKIESLLLKHKIGYEKISIGKAEDRTMMGLVCEDGIFYGEQIFYSYKDGYKNPEVRVLDYPSREDTKNHKLVEYESNDFIGL